MDGATRQAVIATFHHREFDLRQLRRLKREQGAVVSCVVPTLNEAATIVGVLAALRRNVLVDELVVIDSGSMDGTRDLARAAGAVVCCGLISGLQDASGARAAAQRWCGRSARCAVCRS